MSATWEKYNENNPWGKNSKTGTVAVVGGDNIPFSQRRHAAIQAVRNGTATPEQHELVRQTDEAYKMALAEREE